MSAQLAQALQQDAEHWKKLGDQAARDGESAAADAYRVCADQLCEALAAHEAAPQQEPVAWMRDFWGPDCGPFYEIHKTEDMTWRDKESWIPLYAAPQQAQAPTQAEVDLNEALLEVDYWKRIAAHLAAPAGYKLVPIREVQQAQAPGWQLVPVEPTREMLAAVVTSLDEHLLGREAEQQYREDWAAMLAAAPQQGSKT